MLSGNMIGRRLSNRESPKAISDLALLGSSEMSDRRSAVEGTRTFDNSAQASVAGARMQDSRLINVALR